MMASVAPSNSPRALVTDPRIKAPSHPSSNLPLSIRFIIHRELRLSTSYSTSEKRKRTAYAVSERVEAVRGIVEPICDSDKDRPESKEGDEGDDEWYPSVSAILRAQTEEAKAEAVEQVFAGLKLLEETFEKCSKGKGFFAGDAIGHLDIALGCFLGWLKATEKMAGVKFLDEARTPLLVQWVERFYASDAVKGVMPEADKLVEFAKMIQAKFKAAPAK